MADELTTVKRHLTKDDFMKWDTGMMGPEEMEAFLSHTASCDTCAENWMAYMAQQDPETLPQPPAYLAEEIISRSQQPDLLIARKVHQSSRQLRLLTYSLKVSTAVVLSILMLFSINLTSRKISSFSKHSFNMDTAIIQTENSGLFSRIQSGGSHKKDSRKDEKQSNLTDHMRQGTQNIIESLDSFTKSIFSFEFNFNQED